MSIISFLRSFSLGLAAAELLGRSTAVIPRESDV